MALIHIYIYILDYHPPIKDSTLYTKNPCQHVLSFVEALQLLITALVIFGAFQNELAQMTLSSGVEGIFDVVRKPVEGAQTGGIWGFGTGVAPSESFFGPIRRRRKQLTKRRVCRSFGRFLQCLEVWLYGDTDLYRIYGGVLVFLIGHFYNNSASVE